MELAKVAVGCHGGLAFPSAHYSFPSLPLTSRAFCVNSHAIHLRVCYPAIPTQDKVEGVSTWDQVAEFPEGKETFILLKMEWDKKKVCCCPLVTVILSSGFFSWLSAQGMHDATAIPDL